MGLICIETATGEVIEWARNGQPGSYDAARHTLIEADEPPEMGSRYVPETHSWIPAIPDPDVIGFLGVLKVSFPIHVRILISRQYPWFVKAVEDKAWSDVQAYIEHALATAVLTQGQYDAIKAAAEEKHIPVTLP